MKILSEKREFTLILTEAEIRALLDSLVPPKKLGRLASLVQYELETLINK